MCVCTRACTQNSTTENDHCNSLFARFFVALLKFTFFLSSDNKAVMQSVILEMSIAFVAVHVPRQKKALFLGPK
jgi:hypothetical protein